VTTDELLNLKPLPSGFSGSVVARIGTWPVTGVKCLESIEVLSKSGKLVLSIGPDDRYDVVSSGYFDFVLRRIEPVALPYLYDILNTTIVVSQERDRISIYLQSAADNELMKWCDDEVNEAAEDGVLALREAVLGNLERFVKQRGSLHRSAVQALYDRYRQSDQHSQDLA